MVEAVAFLISHQQAYHTIPYVICPHARLTNAPTQFHALIGHVIAALVGLLFSASVNIPLFFHFIFNSCLIADLQVSDSHSWPEVILGDVTFSTHRTDIRYAFLCDYSITVV